MKLNDVLRTFPNKSVFRGLIQDLVSQDADQREKVHERVRQLDRFDSWEAARTPSWFVSNDDALAILKAGECVEFPLPTHEWKDGYGDLLILLWRSPYSNLVPSIGRAYRRITEARRRCALLALLGIIATREAADMFMVCVRELGWPEGVHGRLIEELEKLMAFPDVMLPDVVLSSGKLAKYVGESVLGAMTRGILKMEAVGDRLQPLVPFAVMSLKKATKSAINYQSKPGIAWRFSERYQPVRHKLCVFLDLAGRIRNPTLISLLQEAAEFNDPRIVTFAVLSLLRLGERVTSKLLETSARSHETRSILFNGLREMNLERRFPKKWRTWDSFAAVNMVDWLCYPTELGREPDVLEKMAEFTQKTKHGVNALYVWRFKNDGDVKSFASVSGIYSLAGEPVPIHGSETFSCFEDWESKTAEQHAEAVLETLKDWSRNESRKRSATSRKKSPKST